PHATLLSSEPAAGARLAVAPSRLRLLFSEPIEVAMSGATIADANGRSLALTVAGDPRDVHALVALLPPLRPGAHTVGWHIVSADGHRIDGRFMFTVGRAGAALPNVAATGAADSASSAGGSEAIIGYAAADSGFVAALGRRPQVPALRAAAITVLLALAGLSLLIATLPISGTRPMRLAVVLAVAATALLGAYLAVWSSTAVGAEHGTLDAISLAASTTPGALEIARLALALLALWALWLAKRPGLGALFSGVGVLITGASGHPAVTQPLIGIPAKSVHLAAAAVWLGGLLWIMTAERHGARYVEGTRRISSLALLSVIVVVATGVLQGFLFLPRLAALTDSTYGRLILVKAAGLVVLVFFGAFHRRIVPRLDTTIARRRLRGSVRLEIVVMLAVSVAGGLLAAIAPPR
ncbi:MAG TPA: copper resistance protein CopC, partial [Gemmatimonadaceae bacterium]|nr:copper resistance protein CopC [Gemmatimonadaceae bacterium]